MDTNQGKYEILLGLLCVLVFSFAWFGVEPARAGTAILKIDPPQGTFFVGSSFDISIILDTGGETINAVEAELRFPPNILQVTTPTAARSFIAIWTSPPSFSNQEGYVRFQGGIPAPGLKTSQGVLSTITFRAVQPGSVTLELKNSRVLLADGSGRDILSTALGARYTIEIPPPQGPRVYSPTHPEFTKWYQDKNATFAWDRDEGVSEFSWSLDEIPNGVPDIVTDGNQTAVTYEGLEDGIWYFHIRAKKGEAWGGVTNFSVKIDTAPPAMFTIEFDPKEKVTVDTRTLVHFRTTDGLSGIDRYEIKVVNVTAPGETSGSTFFIEGESPYVLPSLEIGIYSIVVRAYDKAWNLQESSSTFEVTKPVFAPFTTGGLDLGFVVVSWPVAIALLIMLGVILGFLALRFWGRHRYVREDMQRGVSGLRGRIKSDLEVIQRRIEEDEALKERFSKELKKIEQHAEGSRGDSDSDRTRPDDKDNDSDKLGEDSQSKNSSSTVRDINTKIIIFILFGSYVFISSVFAGTPVAVSNYDAGDSVSAPKILTHQLEIASNQLLYLTGLAPPSSMVKIYISGEGHETIIAEELSNNSGEWEHLHGLYLQPGFYQVQVQAETQEGIITEASAPIGFRVTSQMGSGEKRLLGSEVILGLVAFMFFAVNIFLLLFLAYIWHESRRVRRRVRKEANEVHEALRLGFRILKRELEQDLALIEENISTKKRAGLLAKERVLKRSLLEDMQKIERSIEKEVSDIDKVL